MKYYIENLSIHTINFNKLKNDIYYENNTKNIILSNNGYYTIFNNQYYHYFVDTEKVKKEECYYKLKNYLDNYTLYVDNNIWIRKKVNFIPVNHEQINITEHIFKLNEKCNVSFVVEKTEKGEICDAYFLSHLKEDDYSFRETLSYLLLKLI